MGGAGVNEIQFSDQLKEFTIIRPWQVWATCPAQELSLQSSGPRDQIAFSAAPGDSGSTVPRGDRYPVLVQDAAGRTVREPNLV